MAEELRDLLAKAREAQRTWASLPVNERLNHFKKIISQFNREKNLAELITLETGKSLAEAAAEIERCKIPLKYYIAHGKKLLEKEKVDSNRYILFEPIGLVAAFTPWNYPLWGVFRQLAPILLCGNGLIIKAHSRVSRSALAIEEIVEKAGVPSGLVSTVFGNKEIIEPLISQVETVVAITSPQRARTIAEIAGRHLKRINLQLSGSDPFIVLEDADIKKAAIRAAASRLINSGQDCVSAKRFIVRKEIHGSFVKEFVKEMKKAKISPLGHEALPQILESQLEDAVQQGAKILLGGKSQGELFKPTVLVKVNPTMRVWQEETFGPLAPIIPAATDEEAIALANTSPFGLAASIWTKDIERAEKLAKKLEVGMVAINGQPKSNPALPFGGLKQSGMGRDFSKYGLMHFLNTKSVVVNHEK